MHCANPNGIVHFFSYKKKESQPFMMKIKTHLTFLLDSVSTIILLHMDDGRSKNLKGTIIIGCMYIAISVLFVLQQKWGRGKSPPFPSKFLRPRTRPGKGSYIICVSKDERRINIMCMQEAYL